MEKIKSIYTTTLTTWMQEAKQNAEHYKQDFREDEAELEKIKLNIYDVFLKMFNLSLKKTKDKETFYTMYLSYHKNIPKNWHLARDNAKANETIDYYIEDLKITTAERVEKLFINVWENHE